MLRTSRTPVLFLVALLTIAAVAVAAWSPTAKEQRSYTGAISTVRTNLATWTAGTSSGTIGRATKVLLKRADKRLGVAATRFGTNPNWKQVVRSLQALEDGAYFLQQAARLEKRNAAFQTFVTNSGSSLYAQSRNLVLSATVYVAKNTSRKAAKRLLRAGAKATKAQGRSKAGRWSKGIRLNAKVITVFGKAKLL